MASTRLRKPASQGLGRYAVLLMTLGHPTRLGVLEALSRSPLHIEQILAEVGVERTLLSHHLRTLRKMGLVCSRREGKTFRYQLAPSVQQALQHHRIESDCCEIRLERSRKSLAPCACRSFPLTVAICLLSGSAQIGSNLRQAKEARGLSLARTM